MAEEIGLQVSRRPVLGWSVTWISVVDRSSGFEETGPLLELDFSGRQGTGPQVLRRPVLVFFLRPLIFKGPVHAKRGDRSSCLSQVSVLKGPVLMFWGDRSLTPFFSLWCVRDRSTWNVETGPCLGLPLWCGRDRSTRNVETGPLLEILEFVILSPRLAYEAPNLLSGHAIASKLHQKVLIGPETHHLLEKHIKCIYWSKNEQELTKNTPKEREIDALKGTLACLSHPSTWCLLVPSKRNLELDPIYECQCKIDPLNPQAAPVGRVRYREGF